MRPFKFLRNSHYTFENTRFNQTDVEAMVEYFKLHANGTLPLNRYEFVDNSYFTIDSMTGTFTMNGTNTEDNRLRIDGVVTYHLQGPWTMTIRLEDSICVDIKINYDVPVGQVTFRT